MDPDKWDTIVWYRVTRNPQEFSGLTSCQRDPRVLGSHMNEIDTRGLDKRFLISDRVQQLKPTYERYVLPFESSLVEVCLLY